MREDGTTDRQDAAEPLTCALVRAARAVAVRVEEVLRPAGLGLDHWLVVEALAERRARTMADLTTRTLVTGPTLTRVVDRLATNAMVYREVDPEDRRRVVVYLSPRGQATYRRLATAVGRIERDLLDRTVDGDAVVGQLARLGDDA